MQSQKGRQVNPDNNNIWESILNNSAPPGATQTASSLFTDDDIWNKILNGGEGGARDAPEAIPSWILPEREKQHPDWEDSIGELLSDLGGVALDKVGGVASKLLDPIKYGLELTGAENLPKDIGNLGVEFLRGALGGLGSTIEGTGEMLKKVLPAGNLDFPLGPLMDQLQRTQPPLGRPSQWGEAIPETSLPDLPKKIAGSLGQAGEFVGEIVLTGAILKAFGVTGALKFEKHFDKIRNIMKNPKYASRIQNVLPTTATFIAHDLATNPEPSLDSLTTSATYGSVFPLTHVAGFAGIPTMGATFFSLHKMSQGIMPWQKEFLEMDDDSIAAGFTGSLLAALGAPNDVRRNKVLREMTRTKEDVQALNGYLAEIERERPELKEHGKKIWEFFQDEYKVQLKHRRMFKQITKSTKGGKSDAEKIREKIAPTGEQTPELVGAKEGQVRVRGLEENRLETEEKIAPIPPTVKPESAIERIQRIAREEGVGERRLGKKPEEIEAKTVFQLGVPTKEEIPPQGKPLDIFETGAGLEEGKKLEKARMLKEQTSPEELAPSKQYLGKKEVRVEEKSFLTQEDVYNVTSKEYVEGAPENIKKGLLEEHRIITKDAIESKKDVPLKTVIEYAESGEKWAKDYILPFVKKTKQQIAREEIQKLLGTTVNDKQIDRLLTEGNTENVVRELWKSTGFDLGKLNMSAYSPDKQYIGVKHTEIFDKAVGEIKSVIKNLEEKIYPEHKKMVGWTIGSGILQTHPDYPNIQKPRTPAVPWKTKAEGEAREPDTVIHALIKAGGLQGKAEWHKRHGRFYVRGPGEFRDILDTYAKGTNLVREEGMKADSLAEWVEKNYFEIVGPSRSPQERIEKALDFISACLEDETYSKAAQKGPEFVMELEEKNWKRLQIEEDERLSQLEKEGKTEDELASVETKRGLLNRILGPEKKTKSRVELIETIENLFDTRIRKKYFRRRGAAAIYKTKPQLIRTKIGYNLDVLAHEIGHHIRKYYMDNGELFELGAYMKELETFPNATLYKSSKLIKEEGWADYIHYWLASPELAMRKAPRLSKYFAKILTDIPQLKEKLFKFREEIASYASADPITQIKSMISYDYKPPSKGFRPKQWFNQLFTDRNTGIKLFEDALTKGKGAPFTESPYILSRLLPGTSGKAETFLNFETFSAMTMRKTGESLENILSRIKGREKDFDAFLICKGCEDYYRRGKNPGFQGETVLAAGKLLTSKHLDFPDLQKRIVTYNQNLLDYITEMGIVSDKTARYWKFLNQNYVPFYRLWEESHSGRFSGFGKSVVDVLVPIYSRKGGEYPVISPLQNIIKNTYTLIEVAERNKVGEAIANLVDSDPKAARDFAEKIELPVKPTSFTLKEIEHQLIQKGLDLKELSEIMRDEGIEPGITDAIESTLNEVFNIFRPFRPKDSRLFSVLRKDKSGNTYTSHYQLQDSMLADSVRAMMPITINSPLLRGLYNALKFPSVTLRAGSILTPEFMMRNPMKDVFTAFIYTEHGIRFPVNLPQSLFHVLGKPNLYKEWLKSGGPMAHLVSVDQKEMSRTVNDLVQSKNLIRKGVKTITHPLEALRVLSQISEEITRVAEFKSVLDAEMKKGTPYPEALKKSGYASREITLDFNKAGTLGRIMNEFCAFWNPGVQGVDKLLRELKNNPKRVVPKIIASITIPSMLLSILNKDNGRLDDFPAWTKMFWLFDFYPVQRDKWNEMASDEKARYSAKYPIFRISKPFEVGLIAAGIGESVIDYIYKKEPDTVKQYLSQITKSSPFDFSTNLPTVLKPFIELMVNKDLFFDYSIVPSTDKAMKGEMRKYQYRPNTSETAILMSRLSDGLFSPLEFEHLTQSWFSGLGRYGSEALDMISKEFIPEEMRGKKIHRKFIGRIPGIKGMLIEGPYQNAPPIEKFYKIYEELKSVEAGLKKEIPLQEKVAIQRKFYKYIKHKSEIDRLARYLSENRKLIKLKMVGEFNPETLEIYIKRLRYDAIEECKKFLEKW